MKNNKTDSNILDDNYFPEKKTQFHFFRTIGFSFLFITSFVLLYFILFFAVVPYFEKNEGQENVFSILLPMILSSLPYLYIFRLEYKEGNLKPGKWELWVAILTLSFIFLVGIFHLFRL